MQQSYEQTKLVRVCLDLVDTQFRSCAIDTIMMILHTFGMRKLNNRNLLNEWSGDLNWVSTRSKQTIPNFVYFYLWLRNMGSELHP